MARHGDRSVVCVRHRERETAMRWRGGGDREAGQGQGVAPVLVRPQRPRGHIAPLKAVQFILKNIEHM